MDRKNRPSPGKEKNENDYSEKALRTLWRLILAGLVGVLLFGLQAGMTMAFFATAAVGLMVAGASLLIGGFLGFLFGIPRTLQQEGPVGLIGETTGPRAENPGQPVNYRANTNLEQISDWLTKILVGVGLTQLNEIPTALQQVGNSVSAGLGDPNLTPIFMLSSILFFLICGFLFGYLWTRLFLPGAFRQADLESILVQVQQNTTKVNKLEEQMELDARALTLALQQLSPERDVPPPSQEDLNDAIQKASASVRLQIFNQAHDLRKESVKEKNAKMELTIPIFKALIQCDADSPRHRNHAQLAYVLKDKPVPDLKQAEAELTQAIKARGTTEDGWLFYEFNRAICRIRADEAAQAEEASTPEMQNNILSDLKVAAQDDYILRIIQDNADIKKWMSLNKVTIKDLK